MHVWGPAVVALVSLWMLAPLAGAQPEPTLAYLRSEFGFTAGDLRDVAHGRASVRSLETRDGREIAIVGVVRVPVSPDTYITRMRNIVDFKRHEAVRQIGTFSDPPRAEDLAALTLERDHLDELRGCRLQHCDMQLSGPAIERIRAIPWNAPDAAERANRTMREVLTDGVVAYRARGDAALMTYENARHPISVADEFHAMVAAPPAVLQRFARLRRHLTTFPAERAAQTEDVIYWSKEDVGPKVIISVTHMAIQPVADATPVLWVAASKQLYGSHYFDASIGLTILLRDEQPSSTVLVYVNRSRIDALDGFLGGLKRAVVRARGRSAMADTLNRIRARMPQRAH
jgi:hypothetical protein